ncbi:MAG TPA: hypothetical protein DDW45_05145 [Gammaproteobacteria bacterium]|nr:hypothetical protein [Gammaproteobacteria bacterium]
MPNNDWYEYTSEEMQHLGEEPGDILGLIMHDSKPGNGNEQSREMRSPRAQEKLELQATHTNRDWQALLVFHMCQPRSAGLDKSERLERQSSFPNRDLTN